MGDVKILIVMKAQPFNILLADDDPVIRKLVESILVNLGQNVEVVTDGKEAIEVFTRRPGVFDMLITDHSMPHANGLELVRYLRANGFEGKIIVISGSLTPELEALYLARHVDKILQKPFTMERLRETLEGIFSKSKK